MTMSGNMLDLKKAIFFDRDGVLNIPIIIDGKSYAPRKLEDFRLYNGLENSLKKLISNNWIIIVVTNQPDIGNNIVDKQTVTNMNNLILSLLPITAVKMCYHSQKDNCSCRKPKPGMILEAAKEYNIDIQRSVMVGDRWSDIEAGKQAGTKTIFINRFYSEKPPENQDFTVYNTEEAVEYIIKMF